MTAVAVVPPLRSCEDCGGEIEPGLAPLGLFRPVPDAPRDVVWDAVKQQHVRRRGAAARGGRRWREYQLCRRCQGLALMHRSRNGSVMENGRKRALRTRERVPPKKGGRPRLLTDAELAAAHRLYVGQELSMPEIARRLHAARGKGTVAGYTSALLIGWRRLGLATRDRAEVTTLIHRDLGHEVGKRAAQIANKKRCGATTVTYGKRGGRPCGQWAQPGSDVCWNHATFGTVPRGERRARCAATTQRGRRCSYSPLAGGTRCAVHDPGRGRGRAMAARLRGTSYRQRPENLTSYAAVQPALGRYLAWAGQQPRPADQTSGRAPLWRWLVNALDGRRLRNTELSRFAHGDPHARMLRTSAAAINAAVATVLQGH